MANPFFSQRAFSLFFCVIFSFLCTATFAAAEQDSLTDLQTRSAHGDREAQNLLGVKYFSGDGVYEDKQRAADLFKKSASQGLAKAQFNLGYMYHKGLGIPQDYTLACVWYKAAADQGHSEARTLYESLMQYMDEEKIDEIDRLSSQFSSSAHHDPASKKNPSLYHFNSSNLKGWVESVQPAAGR